MIVAEVVNLGKKPGMKAYRLYYPESNKIMISHDVVFEENEAWPWNEQQDERKEQRERLIVVGEHATGDLIENSGMLVMVQQSGGEISGESTEPKRYRILADIYDNTDQVELDEEPMLMGLDEPVNFDQAKTEKCRRQAMKAEIDSIQRNRIWVHHIDVKTAFLNEEIYEEVFVMQPEGFEKKGQEKKVYKLLKALYGLKQAPRAWYAKLNKCLENLGFQRCPYEHAMYTRRNKGDALIVGVYVDDLLIPGTSLEVVEEFKREMSAQLDMSDLGLLTYYLGIEFEQETVLLS
ncbi:uncharacterized protein LOC141674816 [Apium graveolens]|uniref:uncharacterized protein LOC141674816 n=1 Tax=Apium graveolens TaxID=4045 RepID=UPI003D79C414